ncbi:MAG: hypothetical protein M0T70_13930 [Geobacteraceae bacterium]|nr:hypothetical protein [Geobacteraceae bacterium]
MNLSFVSTVLLFMSINIFSYFIDNSDQMLIIATSIGIVQTISILIATKKNNPLELFTMVMLLWMVQYSVTGLLIKGFEIPLQFGVTYAYLGLAAVLANICQLIIAFVWQLPLWSKTADLIPRPSFPSAKESINVIATLWALSLLFRIILIFSGYQSGFEVEAGTLGILTNIMMVAVGFLGIFPIIYFCALLKQNSSTATRMAKIVLAIEVIIMTFFAGTKAGPVILIINFAVAYHYMVAQIKARKTWALLLIAVIFVIPFYAFKLNMRVALLTTYSVTDERPKLSLNDYIYLYSKSMDVINAIGPAKMVEQTSIGLVNRFDVLTTLAGTIAYYDKRARYDLDMYLPLWIMPYVPRFIWKDKGWVGLGLFVSNEILGIPSFTQAAVTSPIEGYIACGKVGSFIISIINGVFVSVAFFYFNNTRSNDDNFILRAYFVSMFLVMLYFNGAFVFIRAISTNLVILWVLFKLFYRSKPLLNTARQSAL